MGHYFYILLIVIKNNLIICRIIYRSFENNNLGGFYIMDNCNCLNNCKVKCTVCECTHNDCQENCMLNSIEITHEKTGADAIMTPHYCKSFCKR